MKLGCQQFRLSLPERLFEKIARLLALGTGEACGFDLRFALRRNDYFDGSIQATPPTVRGYYQAMKKYNVAAILYGHTHARNIYRWNGTPKPAELGVPTFDVDNSAHFASPAQAMLYFHMHHGTLTVRELATKDRWETCAWTSQAWTSTAVVRG